LHILESEDRIQHPDSFVGLVRALEAELLAANLNLTRGLVHGEDIGRGFIYGTTRGVSDLVLQAGEALARANAGLDCESDQHCKNSDKGKLCSTSRPTIEEVMELLFLVQALNAGEITYRAPLEIPTTGAPAARAALSPAAVNPFWIED
jgi:hypothetical protein